ncbi:helix-turn-helix domain-containing protein [Bradyrhizobium sp. DOA1]|uniref:Crp/Fnr family transcriptional regulator n=1 Tax=Bradyrhizobium sp. DOA1 TaxID=1126616 RepID=UPI000B08422C|nr:helix-turn-helix domain-containing protein [Bradyrhizobium sp. DOA1]
MAHLLAKTYSRLELIGQAENGTFELPITQVDLADCLGLSIVHVNRTLQQLRYEGLVATERKNYHLLEKVRLEELGQFDPIYLHRNPSL